MADKIVYKPAGVAETFSLDWLKILVPVWEPNRRYNLGDLVRAPVFNGWIFEADPIASDTWALSGMTAPEFPFGDAETTVDGAIVWTAKSPAQAGLQTISVSVWGLDAGIVEDTKTISGFETFITVSGGVAGEQYRMTNTITRSTGEEEQDSLVLEILNPADV